MKKFGFIVMLAAVMAACGGNAKQAEQDRQDSIAAAAEAQRVADSIAQAAAMDSLAAAQQAALDSISKIAEDAKATAENAKKATVKKATTTATPAKKEVTKEEIKEAVKQEAVKQQQAVVSEADKKAKRMGFQKAN